MYTSAEYQNEKVFHGRASLCSLEWPIGPILAGFQLPLQDPSPSATLDCLLFPTSWCTFEPWCLSSCCSFCLPSSRPSTNVPSFNELFPDPLRQNKSISYLCPLACYTLGIVICYNDCLCLLSKAPLSPSS